MSSSTFLLPEHQQYEEELQQNPYNLKGWLRYIDANEGSPPVIKNLVFERSIKNLPGSYKLQIYYLSERVNQCEGLAIEDSMYNATNNAFERSLTFMHRMPKIQLMYLEFLTRQHLLTKTRHKFDEALQALPITQHDRIQPLYIKFIRQPGIPPETACRVYRRYTLIQPENMEERIRYLKSVHRLDEAACLMADIINDPKFISKRHKSKQSLWNEFCRLICKNPHEIKNLPVEAIIRSSIDCYTSEIGHLQESLAEYYIRLGQFEKGRDIFEQSLKNITTVRDFDIVFNAYTDFEHTMSKAKIEQSYSNTEHTLNNLDIDVDDFDLRLARLEHLLNRRTLCLNSVLLRQNPNNIENQIKRAKIYEEKQELLEVVKTYAEAIKTVDLRSASSASSRPVYVLQTSFARFYEDNDDDLENCRKIFKRAVCQPFEKVDDLASVQCEYAEMELRHSNYEEALDVLKQATTLPNDRVLYGSSHSYASDAPVQDRVYRSTKLQSMYADMEENFGTLETTRSAYDKILDLRIATPQIIINYADQLISKKYFEDSFKVFEKGIALFDYPHVLPIQLRYLTRFIERYAGKKIERTRELFEQCLAKLPSKHAPKLYTMYAEFEEKHGSPKHAMAVYDRLCEAALPEEQYAMYMIFIRRITDLFGAIKSREIFEKAINKLPDSKVPAMCVRYSQLERQLGEIDRARAIFVYGSKFADPRVTQFFWDTWDKFEQMHGNSETYTELNRIKKTISAQFLNVRFTENGQDASLEPYGGSFVRPQNVLQELEENKIEEMRDTATQQQEEFKLDEKLVEKVVSNPNEIDIDIEMGENEIEEANEESAEKLDKSEDGDVQIQTREIPETLFGQMGDKQSSINVEEVSVKPQQFLGALERFRKQKQDSSK